MILRIISDETAGKLTFGQEDWIERNDQQCRLCRAPE